MSKIDKIVKDLKERNDKLLEQYRYRDIRCITLERSLEQLKQENKQLKDKLYEAKKRNNELEQDGQDMAKELSIRIDKAIEYIENNYKKIKDRAIGMPIVIDTSMSIYDELLQILKGSE